MAPAIKSSRSRARTAEREDNSSAATSAAAHVIAEEFRTAMRAYKADVIANTENVGDRFAEEARRMHYGEGTTRAIRGSATAEEASDLHDEGIEFGILPPLPEDKN